MLNSMYRQHLRGKSQGEPSNCIYVYTYIYSTIIVDYMYIQN